jgi:hypothetical protein
VNDYRVLLNGTNAIVDKTDDTGLKFAVVYEDYTAEAVEDKTSKTAMEAAKADMEYLQSKYFSNEYYITEKDAPVLMTFGPRFFKQPAQWAEMFSVFPIKPKFLPLWDHTTFTGDNDNGEYSWVDFTESFTKLSNFYKKAPHVELLMGSAFPRFHDFYVQGGIGDSYGYVDFDNGQTLTKTLALAKDRAIKNVQLVTWNDFGEGTVIEPTLEDEFKCLEIIQQFTGVKYGKAELQLIHSYYLKKKEHKDNAEKLVTLETIFKHLTSLEVDQAKELLDQL